MFGTLPFSAFIFLPNFTRLEVFALSSCANAPNTVSTNSLLPILVIFAVKNCVSMPSDFNFLMFWSRSTVFLAKREMSFTTTISNSPLSASVIIFKNCLRFLIFVPDKPSSAYSFTSLSLERSVYSLKKFFCASSEFNWSSFSVDTRQ